MGNILWDSLPTQFLIVSHEQEGQERGREGKEGRGRRGRRKVDL